MIRPLFLSKSEIVWTAGTTPGPQKALIRALTEVAQLAGDFNTSSNYVASGLPKFKTLEEADYILRTDKVIPISALPDLSHDNLKVEIENCLAALSRKDMQVIALDVTHPKLKIPAFYTIIPGAHFRERAAGTSLAMFSAKLITENGDPTWAIAQLEKMDKILPGKYFIKFYLGSAHLSLSRPAEALRLFEEALALHPKEEDIPSIYSYMGLCLKDLEHYREAISTFEKAEKFDRERTDVYNLMGYCYYKLREHEKAIQCFRRVLEIDPSSAIDYANIASNYRDMGDTERAIRYYRLALELDASIDFARENLKKLEGGRRMGLRRLPQDSVYCCEFVARHLSLQAPMREIGSHGATLISDHCRSPCYFCDRAFKRPAFAPVFLWFARHASLWWQPMAALRGLFFSFMRVVLF